MNITVSEVKEVTNLSLFQVQMRLKSAIPETVEYSFEDRTLVFQRGIRTNYDQTQFHIVKLVFDGSQALAIYQFIGGLLEQIPLTCNETN